MHLQKYLPVFCLFIVGQPATVFAQQRLPRASCSYNNQVLSCDRDNLILPDNFDVGSIPSDVLHIRLECPKYDRNIYCNVMKTHAQPLPALQRLITVGLYGFTGEGNGRFPVNYLLSNVKHRIENLEIRSSRIGNLKKGVLAGFTSLKVLTVGGNGIRSVAVDAFHSLPALHEIHLGHNRIREFDWSTLQPLAETLVDIGINLQSPRLQKLYRSGPHFILKKLSWFTLIGNGLSSIPTEVLDTIPVPGMLSDNRSLVWMEENQFCPANPDCSCCEMKDLFTWLEGIKKAAKPEQNIEVKFSCGFLGQESLHQLMINNGAVDYKTGLGLTFNETSFKSAEFKPSLACATVPPPTPCVVVAAPTVTTCRASQGVVSSSAFLLAAYGFTLF